MRHIRKSITALVFLMVCLATTVSAANEQMSYTSDGRLKTWVNSYSATRYVWVEFSGDTASIKIISPDANNMEVQTSVWEKVSGKYESLTFKRHNGINSNEAVTVDLTPYRTKTGTLTLSWSYAKPGQANSTVDAGAARGQEVPISYVNGEWGIQLPNPGNYKTAKDYWMGETDIIRAASLVPESDLVKYTPVLQEIKSNLKNNYTDYEMLRAIHEWVSTNFWTSSYVDPNWPANVRNYQFIGDCSGYSLAVSALITLADIPNCNGFASNGLGHKWNYAYADNHWVAIDATKDASKFVLSDGRLDVFQPVTDHFDYSVEYAALFLTEFHFPKVRPDTTPILPYTNEAVSVKYNIIEFRKGSDWDQMVGALEVDGNNYVRLRDIAYYLKDTNKRFSVDWDGTTQSIALKSGAEYKSAGAELVLIDTIPTKADPNKSPIYVNGNQLYAKSYSTYEAKLKGNEWWVATTNYFKIRDIAKALDFYVGWDGARGGIIIDTNRPYSDK